MVRQAKGSLLGHARLFRERKEFTRGMMEDYRPATHRRPIGAPQYSEANVCGSPYKTNRDFLHLMRNCRCGTIPISPSDVYSCSCCIVTNANPSAKVKTHGRIRLEVRFEKSYSEHGVLACIFRIRHCLEFAYIKRRSTGDQPDFPRQRPGKRP